LGGKSNCKEELDYRLESSAKNLRRGKKLSIHKTMILKKKTLRENPNRR